MSSTESNPVVNLSAELAKTTLQDGNSAETEDKNQLPTMPIPMAGTMPPDTTGSGDTDVVRIFIGDLAPHTTEQTLTAYFEKWGTIVRALIKHPEPGSTQRTRSFGFISVLGQQAAQAILATPHIIDGVNVGHAELAKQHRAAGYDQTKAGPNMGGGPQGGDGGGWSALNGMPPTRKIFVGGLSHQTKEGTLYTYFSQFGTLSDVVVMTEGSARRPRGFGFVTFEDAASVQLVCRSRFHPIGGRHVEVKPAIPREHMRTIEAQQEAAIAGGDYGGGNAAGGGGEAGEAGAAGWYNKDGWNASSHAYGGVPYPPPTAVGGAPYPTMMIPAGVPVLNGYTPQMTAAGGAVPLVPGVGGGTVMMGGATMTQAVPPNGAVAPVNPSAGPMAGGATGGPNAAIMPSPPAAAVTGAYPAAAGGYLGVMATPMVASPAASTTMVAPTAMGVPGMAMVPPGGPIPGQFGPMVPTAGAAATPSSPHQSTPTWPVDHFQMSAAAAWQPVMSYPAAGPAAPMWRSDVMGLQQPSAAPKVMHNAPATSVDSQGSTRGGKGHGGKGGGGKGGGSMPTAQGQSRKDAAAPDTSQPEAQSGTPSTNPPAPAKDTSSEAVEKAAPRSQS